MITSVKANRKIHNIEIHYDNSRDEDRVAEEARKFGHVVFSSYGDESVYVRVCSLWVKPPHDFDAVVAHFQARLVSLPNQAQPVAIGTAENSRAWFNELVDENARIAQTKKPMSGFEEFITTDTKTLLDRAEPQPLTPKMFDEAVERMWNATIGIQTPPDTDGIIIDNTATPREAAEQLMENFGEDWCDELQMELRAIIFPHGR